ncbi:MAG: hypothetical protein KatS3mg113_1020 [Planctomycetaceae bacterium]|nr:MAG: hypothetical protein KatS3mg113_1020 [Planctomycetaceae bacterium]
MDPWVRLSAEHRDNLVAYLDGELSDEQTQQIDELLMKSEVARHEVEALVRTWELLDMLPRPKAREDFTDRTLTSLRVANQRTSLTDRPWFAHIRRLAWGLIWMATMFLFGWVGWTASLNWIPNPEAEMLADLPLLQNLDLYLEVRDLEFVRQLQREGLFQSGENGAEENSPQDSPGVTKDHLLGVQTQEALRARYRQIEKMPQSQRQRLLNNWRMFQELSPEKQRELRALHAVLHEQPETVWDLLKTYEVWLQTLSPGQRDDLRQADTTGKRLQLVREFKKRQESSRETYVFDLNFDLQRMKPRLPPPPYPDEPTLKTLLENLYELYPPVVKQRIDQDYRQSGSITRRLFDIFDYFAFTMFWQIPEHQFALLLEGIDDQGLKKFIQARNPLEHRWLFLFSVGKGLQAYVLRSLEPYYPDAEKLRRFFVELPGERRHELMQMRPDEMTRELLNDYLNHLDDPEIKSLLAYNRRMEGLRDGRLRDRSPRGPFIPREYRGPGGRGGRDGGNDARNEPPPQDFPPRQSGPPLGEDGPLPPPLPPLRDLPPGKDRPPPSRF